jgi:spore coat protein U domain-containing protein, fimbrial subunit CupE1/2/3/6
MRPSRFLITLAAGAVGLLAAPAEAACTISTTAVNFGTYNVFQGTPDDAVGQVTVRCTTLSLFVRVDLDRGGAPSFDPRQMRQGSEILTYNLFRDAARTTIWGDGTGGTQDFFQFIVPANQNINVSVYGRIPAGQDVSAGAYSNTVTATISF